MPTFIWLSVSVRTDGGGHLRAGAGRGRHADQRQDRAGDLVVADVVARLAAVREDDGGDLGEVHVAAAAEADDGVGPEVARRGRWHAAAARSDGSGSPPEKTSTATPASLSGAWTGSTRPALTQDRVGDDEGPAGAEAAGDVAELRGGVAAEDELAGGVEGPGGAHGGLRGGRRRLGLLSAGGPVGQPPVIKCRPQAPGRVGSAMSDAKRPFDFKVAIPRLRKAVRPSPKPPCSSWPRTATARSLNCSSPASCPSARATKPPCRRRCGCSRRRGRRRP